MISCHFRQIIALALVILLGLEAIAIHTNTSVSGYFDGPGFLSRQRVSESVDDYPGKDYTMSDPSSFNLALEQLIETLECYYREKAPLTHTPIYCITEQEYDWLVKLVFLEAGYCTLETKIAIVSLVFNRLESHIWGDSLEEVLFAKNQFRKKKTLDRWVPYSLPKNPYYERTTKFITAWDESYAAVDYVLEWGGILPPYVMFYRTNYHFRWRGYRGYLVVDNLYFGYLQTHKNKQE